MPNDVPMTVATTSNGKLRFSVPIQIGDAPPFAALLDTGSAGLTILPTAVPDGAYDSISTTPATGGYGGTLAYSGRVAAATLRIGTFASDGTIDVVHVDSFACDTNNPGCSISDEVLDHYSGFGAILGIGMRQRASGTTVGNPIAQLPGGPAFVVRTPAFPGGNGTLRIGPATSELTHFTFAQLTIDTSHATLPNGVPNWDDRSLQSCVVDTTTQTQYCAPSLLDSGTPSIGIALPSHSGDDTVLAPGDDLQIFVDDAVGASPDYAFTVGATPQPGLDRVLITATTSAESINLGTSPFFRFAFYFDQQRGLIGRGAPF